MPPHVKTTNMTAAIPTHRAVRQAISKQVKVFIICLHPYIILYQENDGGAW
jgi:hypothetical protein